MEATIMGLYIGFRDATNGKSMEKDNHMAKGGTLPCHFRAYCRRQVGGAEHARQVVVSLNKATPM